MNSVNITFWGAIRGAYVKGYIDVLDSEVEALIESQRHLNPDGTPHQAPEGLKPFDNIRNVVVHKYDD